MTPVWSFRKPCKHKSKITGIIKKKNRFDIFRQILYLQIMHINHDQYSFAQGKVHLKQRFSTRLLWLVLFIKIHPYGTCLKRGLILQTGQTFQPLVHSVRNMNYVLKNIVNQNKCHATLFHCSINVVSCSFTDIYSLSDPIFAFQATIRNCPAEICYFYILHFCIAGYSLLLMNYESMCFYQPQ